MRRFPGNAVLPLMAVIVFSFPAASQAQFYWNWGWGWNYPSYYSTYYTPSYYSTYYTPSYYSASYTPSYYTASYAPSCGSCCSPCSTCCSPCSTCYSPCSSCYSCGNSCCSPCGNCGSCSNCCPGDCALTSAQSQTSGSSTGSSGSQSSSGGTPTFIEEEDRGTGAGSDYESPGGGTNPGFQLRNSNESEAANKTLDSTFGTSSAGGQDQLRFKIPTDPQPPEAQKSPTRRVKQHRSPEYPLLKLDEKITSRTLPKRTRLLERRSWQPTIAENVTRRSPEINVGWVPVPAPTRLVQK